MKGSKYGQAHSQASLEGSWKRPVTTGEQQSLRSLYVARTVPDQKKYDTFLKLLGVRFGRAAVVRTVTSTHLTILESFGVKEKFYNYGYTPHDVLVPLRAARVP